MGGCQEGNLLGIPKGGGGGWRWEDSDPDDKVYRNRKVSNLEEEKQKTGIQIESSDRGVGVGGQGISEMEIGGLTLMLE